MINENMYRHVLEKAAADGLLDEQAAGDIMASCADGEDFYRLLADGCNFSEGHCADYLAKLLHIERVELADQLPSAEFIAEFPAGVMVRHRLLPLRNEQGRLLVAVCDPLDDSGLAELRILSGCDPKAVLATAAELTKAIDTLLGVGAETMEVLVRKADGEAVAADAAVVELEAAAGDASIITFVNQILSEAIDRRATDVHIEPFEKSLRVRYRVDGVLQEASIPREVHKFHAAIVSRLKILGQLDIAEKRLPQDGRVMLRIGTREIDVRISIIPMLYGEAAVLRLLDRSSALMGLEQLGAGGADLELIDQTLTLPHGIVLVTGPTGSGKTTTLYASLSRINDIGRKIVTIEDPIEYHLYGINQIPVATKAGLDFSRGLRAILRHDPDVVLIGEIRDSETAEIAVQASLTGHLVFSTLHTNDAPSAAMRLVDMGIEPYLVAASLETVVAQRLVRTICPHCKCEYVPDELSVLRGRFGELLPEVFYHGTGCEKCSGSGYIGRRGIFEIMPISEEISAMILRHASVTELRHMAIDQGMRTLDEDGWRLVREGVTTPDEILRLTKQHAANGANK